MLNKPNLDEIGLTDEFAERCFFRHHYKVKMTVVPAFVATPDVEDAFRVEGEEGDEIKDYFEATCFGRVT